MGFWFGAAVLSLIVFPPSLIVTIPLLIVVSMWQAKIRRDIDRWDARPKSEAELEAEKSFREVMAKISAQRAESKALEIAKPRNADATELDHPSDWASLWRSRCDSPAEVAFLEAAIVEFRLFPFGEALKGDISLALQKQLGNARVDFLVNDRLVVEVDGHAYHASPKQSRLDARRDQSLRSQGFRVLRITAHRVFSAPDAAMADVRESLGI